jgi:hypothetical protein
VSWPVERDPVFGCDVWQGKFGRGGYGVIWRDGKARDAHIAVWEETKGPVPKGMVLDHLCANGACVRITHLEPVDQRENMFRRNWRYRLRIERCPKGHDLKLYGMNTPSIGKGGNGRVCRQCDKES